MTTFKVDSCDLYSAGSEIANRAWVVSVTPPTVATSDGAYGGGHIIMASGQNIAVAMGLRTYYKLHVYVRMPTLGTTDIFRITDSAVGQGAPGAGSHVTVTINADGSITLKGDSAVTIGTTAAGVITANTWQHIELIHHASSTGSAKIQVDGSLVGDFSGDFLESAPAFGSAYLWSNNATVHFDDIVFEHFTTAPAFVGVTRIDTLLPDADTAQADFTGAYTDIDDPIPGASDGDTTTITSATVGHDSRFSMGDLPAGRGDILAVNHVLDHKKSDAGARTITPYVKSGTTTDDGATIGQLETYSMSDDIRETDPDTATAWTKSGVDALEAGIKIAT